MTSRRELFAGISILCGLVFAYLGQLIAAILWPQIYSPSYNLIGDFSITTCTTLVHDYLPRFLCSPGHIWFFLGIGLGALCALIAAMMLRTQGIPLALCALSIIPWALIQPDAHLKAALTFGAITYLCYLLSVIAIRPRFFITWIFALVSVAAAGLALRHGLSNPPGFPGFYQRIAIDSLSLAMLMHGSWLISHSRSETPAKREVREGERRTKQEKEAAIRAASERLERSGE